MRLARVVIRHFKGIDSVELFLPRVQKDRPGSANFLSIVGENNTCKSSILEALHLACPGGTLNSPSIDHFPARDDSRGPIEIEMEFDELSATDQDQQAVRGHVHAGIFRIRKTWDRANAKSFQGWAYGPKYEFKDLPESPKKADFDASDDLRALLSSYEQQGTKVARLTKDILENLKQHAIAIGCPAVIATGDAWSENPGGFNAILDHALPQMIFVPAIRDTRDEVETKKAQSSIRQIVNVLFERYLSRHRAVRSFKDAAEGVKALFNDVAKNRFVASLERSITNKLQRLINIEARLDFIPPDVTSDLASKTELWVRDGQIETRPEHQGHGAQRAVILSLLEHLAEISRKPDENGFQRPLLLLVEEPEIYLHPEMCRKMRDVLLQIARSGSASVICTTHSPVFLDLADRHDGIAILSKTTDGHLTTRQRTDDVFGGELGDEERDRLRMILNFDPAVNEVFFTNNVTLVEGDCEIAAIDAVACRLLAFEQIDWNRYLLHRRRLTIVNCRGKWTILPFQRVLNAFGVPYRVVHDHDAGFVTLANQQILELLSNDSSRQLIHTPNFEQQIFRDEWSKDKPWKATRAIREMTDVSSDLIRFFEFALGTTIAALAVPLPIDAVAMDDNEDDSADVGAPRVPRRRNCRGQLPKKALTDSALRNLTKYAGVLTLSAGRCRVPELTQIALAAPQMIPTETILAQISGTSMMDTLFDGDLVFLDRLDGIVLQEMTSERKPVEVQAFRQSVTHDAIYVLALNDDIEECCYTLKRIRIEERAGGDWLLIISADNPETEWGDRGQRIVRQCDRVHFAAKVVALATIENGADNLH